MDNSYQAVVFEAPEGSELMGMLLFPYFDNLASDQLDPILAQYGLRKDNIDPNGWYPLQLMLDITKTISSTGIGSVDVALGKAYAPMLIEQYQVTSIDQYFGEVINQVVRMGLRNIPENYGYLVEKLGHQHYRVTSNMPNANGTNYGSFWEACRLLKKQGEAFSVTVLRGGLSDNYLDPGIYEIKLG